MHFYLRLHDLRERHRSLGICPVYSWTIATIRAADARRIFSGNTATLNPAIGTASGFGPLFHMTKLSIHTDHFVDFMSFRTILWI